MHEYRIIRTLSNALSNASKDFDKSAAWFEDRRREVAERERQTGETLSKYNRWMNERNG